MHKTVIVHTDGSCLGNPGPGGWAAVLRYRDIVKELCGGDAYTTNNRMELLAVLKALEVLKEPCTVRVFTDSQYVCNAVNRGWLARWHQQGFANRVNADLWQTLLDLLDVHQVSFSWIRGHNGDAANEKCDSLARCMAKQSGLAVQGVMN